MRFNSVVTTLVVGALFCGYSAGQTGVIPSGPDQGGIASIAPNTGVLEWQLAPLATGIGVPGLQIGDIDGDQLNEIVTAAAGSAGYWYVLKHDGANYTMDYASQPYTAAIRAVRLADVSGGPAKEVIIVVGGTVYIYDGGTKQLIRSFTVQSTAPLGLRVVDVDSDGVMELVYCDTTSIAVYSLATGLQEWRTTAYHGEDLDVGNVDADSDLEIVVAGAPGLVINGRTHVVEWTYAPGFDSPLRVGDVDQDGMAEIVSGRITVYDADEHSPIYDIDPDISVDALELFDVTGDGYPEVVYGDDQWGQIHVHDGVTGAQLWQISNPDHGVTGIAVGDPDNDEELEILWGAGYSSSGADHLHVYNVAARTLEWRSRDFNGPFVGMAYGDVDADGAPELLLGCFESDSGYADGLLFVYDAVTRNVEYMGQSSGTSWDGLWRIAVANLDDDPQLEIVIAAGSTYDGVIYCIDGLTHAVQWRTTTISSSRYRGLQIADVDGDGQLEVIASSSRETSGASAVYVYVYNGATGVLEWRSTAVPTSGALSYLRVGNVDDDPNLEIVTAGAGGGVFVFDGVTHLQQVATAALSVSSLQLADLDGNGANEIYIGTSTGAIKVIDQETSTALSFMSVGASAVNGLQFGNYFNGPSLEVAYCVGGQIFIRRAASSNSPLIWSSPTLGATIGASDSMMIADVDGDSRPEVVVNTGTRIEVFELRRSPAGDMNCDGLVNGFDIDPFVLSIVRPEQYAVQFPGCDIMHGDVDLNGRFDNFDIDPFVNLLVD